MTNSRSVLLIAFHFPPIRGSSGVQRTLRFAQHLPKYGWRPVVLTICTRAYKAVSGDSGNELPRDVEVYRAFGLDAAATLSIFGRYPRAFALPDRWASWRLWGVRKALRIVRNAHIDVIWSTFPIATAHRIGLEVARQTGLPWVAEFRDPMWQGDYPPDRRVNRAWRELEVEIFDRADKVVVATPGALSMYAERFPQYGRSRIVLIENGYDEESFERAAGAGVARSQEERAQALVLVHSGLIDPSERDPTHLFRALASLKHQARISGEQLQVILRACGNEALYAADIQSLGIGDIVKLEGAVGYLPALREMLAADGLLVLQGASCNAQVPAKLYEYLRAGRPILALTDASGDTARTLEAAGAGTIVPLDSASEIEAALPRFLEEIRTNAWRRATSSTIATYSREAQAGRLAQLLDQSAAPAAWNGA